MNEDFMDNMSKRILFQFIVIIFLIAAFIIGGKILFKDTNTNIIDTKSQGLYSIDLVSVGSPSWPFGGHKGNIVLKNNIGKVVSTAEIYVNNDGANMDKNNWSVIWENDRVVVTICGYDAPKPVKYYLYFDGKVEEN